MVEDLHGAKVGEGMQAMVEGDLSGSDHEEAGRGEADAMWWRIMRTAMSSGVMTL